MNNLRFVLRGPEDITSIEALIIAKKNQYLSSNIDFTEKEKIKKFFSCKFKDGRLLYEEDDVALFGDNLYGMLDFVIEIYVPRNTIIEQIVTEVLKEYDEREVA